MIPSITDRRWFVTDNQHRQLLAERHAQLRLDALRGIQACWDRARNYHGPILGYPRITQTLRSVRPRPDTEPLTGMRLTWSEGKTVFRYPEPEDRPFDVATATLEQLVGDVQQAVASCTRRLADHRAFTTVDDGHEIESISRSARRLIGSGVLSTDAPSSSSDSDDDEPGTIGAYLADDHPIRSFRLVKAETELTDEERNALQVWTTERNAEHNPRYVPYVTFPELTLERIEREREHVNNPPPIVTRLVIQDGPDGQRHLRLASNHWFDSPAARQAHFARVAARITALYGHPPSVEEIELTRRWFATWKTQIGYRPWWYTNVYLWVDPDPYREALAATDEDLHHAYEWYEDPTTGDRTQAKPIAECQSSRCERSDWHTVFAHRDFRRPTVHTHWRGRDPLTDDLRDRTLWHSRLTPPAAIGRV